MDDVEESVDRVAAETGFSGVVRVDRGDDVELAKAYGLADRGHQVAATVDTQFAIASGGKGLTALTVVSLIEASEAVHPLQHSVPRVTSRLHPLILRAPVGCLDGAPDAPLQLAHEAPQLIVKDTRT